MWWTKKKIEANYIFSINTGRSGSQYLAELLATAKDAVSFHEPDPKMHDKYLWMVEDKGLKETYADRLKKVRAIEKEVRRSNAKAYIETNHMFIKSFYDIVCQELSEVKVVFLQRDILHILKSFYELRYFTEENQAWKRWMTSPLSKNSAIPFVGEKSDPIDLSIGYIIDIYARGERFREAYPCVKTVLFEVSNFKDETKVLHLFESLGLQPTDLTKRMLGVVSNARSEKKKKFNVVVDTGYLSSKLRTYVARLHENDVRLPDSVIFEAPK